MPRETPPADKPPARVRAIIGPGTRPRLARGVRLRHDAQRNCWIVLAPERVLAPSETAIAILQCCDGNRTVEDIATTLSREYDAPVAEIIADMMPLLQDMADKGFVDT